MVKKRVLLLFALVAGVMLGGCSGSTFTNLTPERIPQNPSGIYTLSFKPSLAEADVVPSSLEATIVIDGQEFPMKRSDLGPRVFTFEYRMPPDRSKAKYYFILRYEVDRKGARRDRMITSEINTLRVTNRYVITMESERGPVGAIIPIVGRGFSEYDTIVIDGVEAQTRYASPNSLSFRVPALPANETYQVSLRTGAGEIPVGEFRVDPSGLYVTPDAVNMASGKRTTLVVRVDSEIPSGGLGLEVTTNIPESVIMPEMNIPAGARTLSMPMKGGEPGEGSLFITAPGFEEVVVPVTVTK